MDYSNPNICIIGLDQQKIEATNPDDPEIYFKALKTIYYCSPDLLVLFRDRSKPISDFELEQIKLGLDLGVDVLQICHVTNAPENTVWCRSVQVVRQGEGPSWNSMLVEAQRNGQDVSHLIRPSY